MLVKLHYLVYVDIITFIKIFSRYQWRENKDGETPLFISCEEEKLNLIIYLVEQGADISKENYYHETPLFIFCWRRNLNIVKYLVKSGADINKENENGRTPLFDACKSGYIDLVNYLITLRSE